jgi:hypothetical protein
MGGWLWMVLAMPVISGVGELPVGVAERPAVLGSWKGSSVCQVKSSPCHDETVVYQVTPGATGETFRIGMSKIVDGKEVSMGNIDCKNGAERGAAVCKVNDDTVWSWKLDGEVWNGTLMYHGELFRKIRATRAQ